MKVEYKMTGMDKIKRDWEKFSKIPYPDDIAGKEIDGVCITSLDTFAAGCIDRFVSNDFPGDIDCVKILNDCAKDYQRIKYSLDGPAKDYYEQLYSLIIKLLKKVS